MDKKDNRHTYMNVIVNFIRNTTYKDIPDGVREVVKYAFKDTIGVSLAAVDTVETKIVKEIIIEANEQMEDVSAIELALGGKGMERALLFGTMSHVLDFDDVNFTFQGHPSVTLIPIILTIAKERNLTGQEMMRAYAIGFEVEARIGESIGGRQYSQGYHTTSTVGIFGAIAAVSALMDFDAKQIKQAFGLASSLAAGSRKNFGTMTKPLHIGYLNQNVYLLSQLIKKGLTATTDIFSDPISIDTLTTGEKLDLSNIYKIGQTWELEEFGIIFKKYPCCAYTHRSIDGVLELANKYDISADEVENIEVIVHYHVPKVLIYPNAKTSLEGKFSMQYCLAAALFDREITLQTFTDENVNREKIQDLMSKVVMTVDKEQEEGSGSKEKVATVKINTKSKTLKKKVEYPIGHPSNPFTEKDMHQKFTMCLEDNYESAVIESLYDKLTSLEQQQYNSILKDMLYENK